MQNKRRGIIIIALVAALLIGGTVYAVVNNNRSDDAATTATNGNSASDAPSREAADRPQPQPAPSQPANNTDTPNQLANTGPGDTLAYVLLASFAGGIGHALWRRRRT